MFLFPAPALGLSDGLHPGLWHHIDEPLDQPETSLLFQASQFFGENFCVSPLDFNGKTMSEMLHRYCSNSTLYSTGLNQIVASVTASYQVPELWQPWIRVREWCGRCSAKGGEAARKRETRRFDPVPWSFIFDTRSLIMFPDLSFLVLYRDPVSWSLILFLSPVPWPFPCFLNQILAGKKGGGRMVEATAAGALHQQFSSSAVVLLLVISYSVISKAMD